MLIEGQTRRRSAMASRRRMSCPDLDLVRYPPICTSEPKQVVRGWWYEYCGTLHTVKADWLASQLQSYTIASLYQKSGIPSLMSPLLRPFAIKSGAVVLISEDVVSQYLWHQPRTMDRRQCITSIQSLDVYAFVPKYRVILIIMCIVAHLSPSQLLE